MVPLESEGTAPICGGGRDAELFTLSLMYGRILTSRRS